MLLARQEISHFRTLDGYNEHVKCLPKCLQNLFENFHPKASVKPSTVQNTRFSASVTQPFSIYNFCL